MYDTRNWRKQLIIVLCSKEILGGIHMEKTLERLKAIAKEVRKDIVTMITESAFWSPRWIIICCRNYHYFIF